MSLFLATLLPGLFLVLLGAVLCWNGAPLEPKAKALPRSATAAWALFGAAAAWFVWRVSHLNEADLIFFQSPTPVMIGFAVLAVLSFIYSPDFLAVRGICVLLLLACEPLLNAAYMEWDHPQRLLMVSVVYGVLAAVLYLAAYPFRLRDAFEWLFRSRSRPRLVGGILLAYGLATTAAAFTY
jgi:hypothetical protein